MNGFHLSSQNMSFIERLPTKETFSFCTNSKKYLIPRCAAVFLSEKVFLMLKRDYSASELKIKTKDSNGIFEQIIQLAYGKQIVITESNRDTILLFARELGNSELIEACKNFDSEVKPSAETIKVAITTLKSKVGLHISTRDDVIFLAKNIYDANPNDLSILHLETLLLLIRESFSYHHDEKRLYHLIFNIALNKKSELISLFEFVNFNKIDKSEKAHFREVFPEDLWTYKLKEIIDGCESTHSKISENSDDSYSIILDHIPDQVQVSPHPKPAKSPKKRSKKKENPATHEDITGDFQDNGSHNIIQSNSQAVEYEVGSDPFKGVINSFPVLKGSVAINASSKNTGVLSKIVKFNNNTNFWTHSNPESWIKIEFKQSLLILKAYSLLGRCDYDFNQMQSWNLEAFSNGTWITLDSHHNEPLVRRKPRTFYIKGQNEPYKSYRILQTGPNTRGDNDIVLSRIEFFGTLIN